MATRASDFVDGCASGVSRAVARDDPCSGAQYMLGPFGTDSTLRRYGQALMLRGGKNAKRRAVVAVARKVAVLLHRLWITGEVYEPLREARSLPPLLAPTA